MPVTCNGIHSTNGGGSYWDAYLNSLGRITTDYEEDITMKELDLVVKKLKIEKALA
jgi:hypothetical protein